MKSLIATLSVAAFLLPAVHVINMTFYNSQCGVYYAFGPFYEELLAKAETSTSTSDFMDFFTANGSMVVMENAAHGAEDILALKQALLPVDGSVRWNHFPNFTFVAEDTHTTKTFQKARILHVVTAGNCSTTYFSTRFVVTKNSTTGIPSLQSHSRSLVTYEGFSVKSSPDPCFASY